MLRASKPMTEQQIINLFTRPGWRNVRIVNERICGNRTRPTLFADGGHRVALFRSFKAGEPWPQCIRYQCDQHIIDQLCAQMDADDQAAADDARERRETLAAGARGLV